MTDTASLAPGTYSISLVTPVYTGLFFAITASHTYRANQLKLREAVQPSIDGVTRIIIPDAPHADPAMSREQNERSNGWSDYGGTPRTPFATLRFLSGGEEKEFGDEHLSAVCRERWYTLHDFGVMTTNWRFEVRLREATPLTTLRARIDAIADGAYTKAVSEEAARYCKAVRDAAETLALLDKSATREIERQRAQAGLGLYTPISIHRIWRFTPDQLPEAGECALAALFEISTLDGFNLIEIGPGARATSGYMNTVQVADERGQQAFPVDPVVEYYGYIYAAMMGLDEQLMGKVESFLRQSDRGQRRTAMRESLNRFRDLSSTFIFRHEDELNVLKAYQLALWRQLCLSWRLSRLDETLHEKISFLHNAFTRAAQRQANRLSRLLNAVFGFLTSLTLVSAIADLVTLNRTTASAFEQIRPLAIASLSAAALIGLILLWLNSRSGEE